MDPIELLMDEHRTIERVMDALDACVDPRNPGAAQADLAGFVTFLRDFADLRHHGKEEDILFAAMIDNGFPRDAGPIAVMLGDHDEGRSHVRALAALASADAPWTAGQRASVTTHARAFTALLRAHIQKEDQILYPMALRHLPEGAMSEVTRRFGEFEAGPAAARCRTDLYALASSLSNRSFNPSVGKEI